MKKIQVFISSTYLDLTEERQAAVEAILEAGHLPAGMELFKAGDESQLETIKRWIDESDVFLLILGGRYGSIDEKSEKSYTQLEYEYAIKKKIPIFSVVLNDSTLHQKAAKQGNQVMESINEQKFLNFKKLVLSKIVKQVDDVKDIKIAIHSTLTEFIRTKKLVGWVRGDAVEDMTALLKENSALLKQNVALQDKLKKLEEIERIGKWDFKELKTLFENKTIELKPDLTGKEEVIKTPLLDLVLSFKNSLTIGVTNSRGSSKTDIFLFYNVSPLLISYGLMEAKNVPGGGRVQRILATKNGNDFFARLELEDMVEK